MRRGLPRLAGWSLRRIPLENKDAALKRNDTKKGSFHSLPLFNLAKLSKYGAGSPPLSIDAYARRCAISFFKFFFRMSLFRSFSSSTYNRSSSFCTFLIISVIVLNLLIAHTSDIRLSAGLFLAIKLAPESRVYKKLAED